MTAPVLDVAGLTVTIPGASGLVRPVRGVDLRLERGEALCLVGESGSGKSMTALALMNLLPAGARVSADRLTLQGESLVGASEERMRQLRGDRIAMIFQEPMTALNPAYSIGEQMVEGLLVHRPATTRAQAARKAEALLATCGIAEAGLRLRQYPHQLSGGLRQRVMIATALMTEPDLLIADEPTTALDVTIQAQILALLSRLQRDLALAIILITHDLGVVGRFGHRVAVMYAGEIVESAPTRLLFERPLHPYTRALLACLPAAPDGRRPPRLGHIPGTPPSLAGDLSGCQFRFRCAFAQAICAESVPARSVGAERTYRCVLPPETLAVAAPREDGPRAEPAAPAGEPAIELRDVAVTYPVSAGLFAPKRALAALRGIDLVVRRGESLGIVGESGCGKSTLVRVMLGLEPPSRGAALLFGRAVGFYGRAAFARLIQPVFQDPYSSLNPRKRVGAIIGMPLDVHGIGTAAERRDAVARTMELCGLPARLADALPAQLSGGQRQRVAIASALVARPAILVCDEPTSALDMSVQAQILNLLHDLRSELGLTTVVISHDLGAIRHLADRIAVMYLGRVVEEGTADDIFGRPAHPYTRMLLAAELPGQPRRDLPAGELPNPIDPPSGCAFRPRCPHAMPICAATSPALRQAGPGMVACHFDLTASPEPGVPA